MKAAGPSAHSVQTIASPEASSRGRSQGLRCPHVNPQTAEWSPAPPNSAQPEQGRYQETRGPRGYESFREEALECRGRREMENMNQG